MHILWLKTELLHPLDKGGRIRTYQMLRQLLQHHRITYLTLDDGRRDADAIERAVEYSTEVECVPFRTAPRGSLPFYAQLARNIASPLPYAIAKYRSHEMRRRISQLLDGADVDLLVCDFLAPAVNVPAAVHVPTVLFQHNVEAQIWQRHAALAATPLRRAYLHRQWRRMYAFERAECRRFDHVIAVSAEDAEWFSREYHPRAASSVPTGVDADYFRPTGAVRPDSNAVLFTGSMDWMPNEDGVAYFVDAILPRVQVAIPAVTLTVVGRKPSPAVMALPQRNPGVHVTGTVPDTRPYLERASVVVVPLRIGGGTRLKIFEAMAMEKAIVTSTIGAEGLPVQHGEHLLIADTPQAFADAVTRLLRDPQYASTLGARAAELVRSRFGWDNAAERFAEICLRTVDSSLASEQRLVHS